jgi:multidrug efflux pump subunit AcrA (membrane-fusion protein)
MNRRFNFVAQIFNLPYRRFSTCEASEPTRDRLEVTAPRRFQIGDTAKCNSALPLRRCGRCGVEAVLAAVLTLFLAGCGGDVAKPQFVCTGRVEPVDGEVEVSAQMAGTLEAVLVKEGDWVEKEALLASVDARREKAQLDLAEARLARVKAGHGAEEIAAVVHQREALEADLAYAQKELERARKLRETAAISDDELESKQKRVASLQKQIESLGQQAAAMKRGPIPEEIAVAQAEVEAARTSYELRHVRAQSSGAILHLYRHTGDYVSGNWPTPILRMADTNRLQVRIEVGESDGHQVTPGMTGTFTVFGMTNELRQLTIRTILPSFAPKRLFDPDGNARLDTRTLQALCDLKEPRQPVYSGQRVLVRFHAH